MAAIDLFQRIGNFADGRFGARRVDRKFEQVAVAGGRAGQRVEGLLQFGRIAFGAQPRQLFELLGAHGGIVDLEHVDRCFVGRLVFVDADHRLHAGIDAGLRLGGRFLNAQLRDAGLDGLGHAAERFDFLDMRPGLARQFVSQLLDVVRAAPRIDDAGGAGFLLQHNLGVAGDARREIGR